MKSIWGLFIGMMFFVTIFYSMSIVGEQIQSNSNLDNTSFALIGNLTTDLDNNFNPSSSFSEGESNLSVNATFDGEDVFAQEYLQRTSDSQKKASIVASVTRAPDVIFLSMGVSQSDVGIYKTILALILSVALSFAIYRMFFGGGKITTT